MKYFQAFFHERRTCKLSCVADLFRTNFIINPNTSNEQWQVTPGVKVCVRNVCETNVWSWETSLIMLSVNTPHVVYLPRERESLQPIVLADKTLTLKRLEQ